MEHPPSIHIVVLMLDDFILENLKFYKSFLSKNTISASQRLHRIDTAIETLGREFTTTVEYVESYKALVLVKDIIHEMCDNYLVDAHTQEILKEKMNFLTLSLSRKRDAL